MLRTLQRPLSSLAGACLRQPASARAFHATAAPAVDAMGAAMQVTLTGADQPGIVAKFCEKMATTGATLVDVDDIVVHDKVALQCIVKMPAEASGQMLTDLLLLEKELNLSIDYGLVNVADLTAARSRRGFKAYSITMLGSTIDFASLGGVASACYAHGFNIVRMERLSPFKSFANAGKTAVVELTVEGDRDIVDSRSLRQTLFELQRDTGNLDIAVQKDGSSRRQKRMVVMDMDSTLIQQEVIDEIARIHGVYDEVAKVTEEAMNGEMDFDESLRMRCACLKGAPESVFDDVYDIIELTQGANDFVRVLKALGYKVAVLSGGFTQVVDRVRDDLQLDYAFANTLEVVDGKLTGEVLGPIVNRERKRDLLISMAQAEKITSDQVIAVGDGANDLDMLREAGLGVAFNAKPRVQEVAEFTLNRNRLDNILYLLGIRPKDVPDWLAKSSFDEPDFGIDMSWKKNHGKVRAKE
jgi:phosphoserine phosphatase